MKWTPSAQICTCCYESFHWTSNILMHFHLILIALVALFMLPTNWGLASSLPVW